jgi:hypothetical protein
MLSKLKNLFSIRSPLLEYQFLWALAFLLIFQLVFIYLGDTISQFKGLSTLLYSLVGFGAGLWISHFYYRKSKEQDLGRLGSAGFRMSISIYEGLQECVEYINNLRKESMAEKKVTVNNLFLILNSIDGMLKITQRAAILANENWREVLPQDQLTELIKREIIINKLSDTHSLVTTKETIRIKSPPSKD